MTISSTTSNLIVYLKPLWSSYDTCRYCTVYVCTPNKAYSLVSAGLLGQSEGGPGYMRRKFISYEWMNSIRETNGNFHSCNSCKRLVPSRLHELHESKFPFVSRIKYIRSKLSNFSAHVSDVSDGMRAARSAAAAAPGRVAPCRPAGGGCLY